MLRNAHSTVCWVHSSFAPLPVLLNAHTAGKRENSLPRPLSFEAPIPGRARVKPGTV